MDTIKRLRGEMDAEREMQMEKRKQEKEYLRKMLEDNEANKAKQRERDEQERLDDLRA